MSHRWAGQIKQTLNTAGKGLSSGVSNLKDDMTRKKNHTKDTEFGEIQKQFDEKFKIMASLTADAVGFQSGSEAILRSQKSLAEDLLKVVPDNSPMASLCNRQIQHCDQMLAAKVVLDKQINASFIDPINAYTGQYREVSDRIRERARREGDMEKLMNERDKFQEKGDARLASTETKLNMAITAYEELNTELKKDIPALLAQAEEFYRPLMLLMVINQTNFWNEMSRLSVAFGQSVDTSQATVPQLPSVLTPKQTSAMTKKFSVLASSPWERPTPAIPGGRGGRRADDWTCGDCSSLNFAFRDRCFSCNAGRTASKPRASATTQMQPGDWLCPSCKAHNFARRIRCLECSTPKEQ